MSLEVDHVETRLGFFLKYRRPLLAALVIVGLGIPSLVRLYPGEFRMGRIVTHVTVSLRVEEPNVAMVDIGEARSIFAINTTSLYLPGSDGRRVCLNVVKRGEEISQGVMSKTPHRIVPTWLCVI